MWAGVICARLSTRIMKRSRNVTVRVYYLSTKMKRSRDADVDAQVRAAPTTDVAAFDSVIKYELFKVQPRWVFLRLETKAGIIGWGEPNLEGWSNTVMEAVKEMMPAVIGQDCSRIEYIHAKLTKQKFYAGGPVLMSAMRT